MLLLKPVSADRTGWWERVPSSPCEQLEESNARPLAGGSKRALILLYAVAAVSAVGSSIGTLSIVLPLASPLLLMGDIGLMGFVAAVSFSAVIVDVSPLSSNEVMVLANAQVPSREMFQTSLFKYTGYIVLVVPRIHKVRGTARGRPRLRWLHRRLAAAAWMPNKLCCNPTH